MASVRKPYSKKKKRLIMTRNAVLKWWEEH